MKHIVHLSPSPSDKFMQDDPANKFGFAKEKKIHSHT